jgi:hypothetical protein
MAEELADAECEWADAMEELLLVPRESLEAKCEGFRKVLGRENRQQQWRQWEWKKWWRKGFRRW